MDNEFLLQKMFGLLGETETLRLSIVSKKWCEVSRSSPLWFEFLDERFPYHKTWSRLVAEPSDRIAHQDYFTLYKELADPVSQLLYSMDSSLEAVNKYEGSMEALKRTMNSQDDAEMSEAAKQVLGSIQQQFSFYQTARQLYDMVNVTLDRLKHNIDPVTLTHFCEFLQYALQFDLQKMTRPQLTNDLTFYRRLQGRLIAAGEPAQVSDEMLRNVGLFMAWARPVLRDLESLVAGKEAFKLLSRIADHLAKQLAGKTKLEPRIYNLYAHGLVGCFVLGFGSEGFTFNPKAVEKLITDTTLQNMAKFWAKQPN